MLSEKLYATICFLVLMQDEEMKHVYYVQEKMAMLDEGLNAFAWLDWKNMAKVIDYLRQYKLEIPEVWKKECDLQNAAAAEMRLD